MENTLVNQTGDRTDSPSYPMFLVKWGGRLFYFSFELLPKEPHPWGKGISRCCIYIPGENRQYIGKSWCSKKDKWDPERGRREALKHALKSMRGSREFNTLAWETYFSALGGVY